MIRCECGAFIERCCLRCGYQAASTNRDYLLALRRARRRALDSELLALIPKLRTEAFSKFTGYELSPELARAMRKYIRARLREHGFAPDDLPRVVVRFDIYRMLVLIECSWPELDGITEGAR